MNIQPDVLANVVAAHVRRIDAGTSSTGGRVRVRVDREERRGEVAGREHQYLRGDSEPEARARRPGVAGSGARVRQGRRAQWGARKASSARISRPATTRGAS
jgi:hypothetical protein